MNYIDLGYNDFLIRPLEASFTEQISTDSSYNQISGSQITGDKITSLNGSFEIDLQNDSFVVKDGVVNRIEFGRLSDGSIGLLIRDSDNNELMRFTGDTNVIKSSAGTFELNFNNDQIIIKDGGGTPRILIGKQVGGF